MVEQHKAPREQLKDLHPEPPEVDDDFGDELNPETPTWLMIRENATVWCAAGPFAWSDDEGMWAALTSLVEERLQWELTSGVSVQNVPPRDYFLLYVDEDNGFSCVSYGPEMIKEIEDEFWTKLDPGPTVQ